MKAVSYIGYFKSVQEVQFCSPPRSQLSLKHSPLQHLSPRKKKTKKPKTPPTLKYKHSSESHLLWNLRLKFPSVTCTQLSKHKTLPKLMQRKALRFVPLDSSVAGASFC